MIVTPIVFVCVATGRVVYAVVLWFGVDRAMRNEAETELVERRIKTELIRAGREIGPLAARQTG